MGTINTPTQTSSLQSEVMSGLPTPDYIHFAMWLLNVVYGWTPRKVGRMSQSSLERWVKHARNRMKVGDILALNVYFKKPKESLWKKISSRIRL